MIHEELTTEEVESALESNAGRIVVRLPLMGANDVAIERSVGFLRTLEEEEKDMDVIIFSRNSIVHTRVNGDKKSADAERLAYRLHLDYLAYSEFIVSIPESEKNAELLKRLALRYGL